MPHRLPLWATLPHLITLGVLCGTLLAIWPATLGRALVTLLLAGIIRLLAGPMVALLVRP